MLILCFSFLPFLTRMSFFFLLSSLYHGIAFDVSQILYFLLVILRSLMSIFSLLLVFIYRSCFFARIFECVRVFLLLLLLNHLRFLRSYSFDVVVYNFSVCCFMLLLSFVVVVVVVVIFLAFTFSFSLFECFGFCLCVPTTIFRFDARYWPKITLTCGTVFFARMDAPASFRLVSLFRRYYCENGRFVCARNRFNDAKLRQIHISWCCCCCFHRNRVRHLFVDLTANQSESVCVSAFFLMPLTKHLRKF